MAESTVADCMNCRYNIPGDCSHPENTSMEFWRRIHKSVNDDCIFFKSKDDDEN